MIKWLFEMTGYGWIVILVFILLRIIDKIIGKPVEAFLDAEYYPSIIAKYLDKDRLKYTTERAWVHNNFKEYLGRALREQGFTTWKLLINAWWKYDYITMYNIMQDLDEYLMPDGCTAYQIK